MLRAGLNAEALVDALFFRQLALDGLGRLQTIYWFTDVTTATIPGADELFVTTGRHWHRSVLRFRGALVHVVIGDGAVTVRIAHDSHEDATVALEAARLALPEREPTEDQRVPMWLWSAGSDGDARASCRSLEVVPWDEIRANYPDKTRTALDGLMRESPPMGAPRLVVWTGDAGTGKTTALRALAWEWRHRYELHCVIDPEVLLGRSDYLVDVLQHGDRSDSPAVRDGVRGRGLLLVMEDAGELLSVDAKERVGQGLSRLLNLADGLLGWSRDVIVLLTTNEPVGALHPAVVRPGRCRFHREFERLSALEATAWLRARLPDCPPMQAAATLAELFGLVRGDANPARVGQVGF